MRVIQMTLDDDLVRKVDVIVNELRTTRSAFTRAALREAVKKHNISQLESRHRKGYAAYPIDKDELSVWEKEQDWGDNEKR